MPQVADRQLPVRRPELVIRPLGEQGQYVVKDPRSGEFFHLGPHEHFLLMQLDGARSTGEICAAFEQHFDEPLSTDDLQEFLDVARTQGLLVPDEQRGTLGQGYRPNGSPPPLSPSSPLSSSQPAARNPHPESHSPTPHSALPTPHSRQSILYWRKNIYDPDRLFTWLEPKIRFFWTPGFLAFSALCIVVAALLLWANRQELAASAAAALRLETAVWAWLMLLVVTALHESAHGLTCKHHGGEVHEIGFLLMFFMPCFYCNVSDAWLFKEKSKRLWVTFAGGYFELFVWALAVFAWLVTTPDTLVNHLAFVVLTICGVQTLFNFNPLLKLDGYYLLSDLLEVPNLQQRSVGTFKAHLRRLLWGARLATPDVPLPVSSRPSPASRADKTLPPSPATTSGTVSRAPNNRFLLLFGATTWLYQLVFLALMLWAMFALWAKDFGILGIGAVAMLGLFSTRGLMRDTTRGEAREMFLRRHKRAAGFAVALCGLAGAMFIPFQDRVGGPFQVRCLTRGELRAPVAGFLKEVYCDQGDRVSEGQIIARLDVPDLDSRLAQKRAEVAEAQAKLALLECGPRPEEVAEQRQRVERAIAWRNLAAKDLGRLKESLAAELVRLQRQIAQHAAEHKAAQAALDRSAALHADGLVTDEALSQAERNLEVAQSEWEQAQAARDAAKAKGALEAEAELARREKELADCQTALRLLQAGTRPEEIQAQRSSLARLQEEVRHLEALQAKLPLRSAVAGVVSTAHLKEKIGQYLREGDLVCLVENPSALTAEIAMSEQDVERVAQGQKVWLKARGLPYDWFAARVEQIAPAAELKSDPQAVQGTLTIRCSLAGASSLRPGMSGYARIYTGERTLGGFLLDRSVRFLRTEFWW